MSYCFVVSKMPPSEEQHCFLFCIFPVVLEVFHTDHYIHLILSHLCPYSCYFIQDLYCGWCCSRGGTDVPSSFARAASVSAEYPRSSNSTPWQIRALAAWLNRLDVLSPIPCSTPSCVFHSLTVQSLIRTLTLVGLELQVWLSSRWMVAHIFLCLVTQDFLYPRRFLHFFCLPGPL